jgi:putative ABC transport system ATP-binding protein
LSVGLGHRIDAAPSKLSGGEKQRVSIARALAGSPSVILADEPTAALDAKNGQAVMELLAEVGKDKNRAVLAVTHDHRTLKYAGRIVRIDDGRIASSERPAPGTYDNAQAEH